MKYYLFLIVLFFLLISAVSANNNDLYVGADNSNASFENIKTAIDNASSGDTIYIGEGNYSGVNNTNLLISKDNLTIKAVDGDKVIIDGNKSNIFTITASNITLSGFTFVNAYSSQGSAVNVRSSYVTVSGCDFINNSAGLKGGSVYVKENHFTLDNCNFVNSNSVYGGAVHIDGASNTVSGCNFINCSATNGGAIDWYRKSSTLLNSTFINCHASANGGAMSFDENTVTVSNCIFRSCHANSGGAVYALLLKGSISGCNFTNNSAGFGSVFTLYDDSNLKLTNLVLINNKALSKSIDFNITPIVNGVIIKSVFTGQNTLLNGIYKYSTENITFSNVTYLGVNGVSNTGDKNSFVIGAQNSNNGELLYLDSRQCYQNLTVEVFDSENKLIKNVSGRTDLYGEVTLRLDNLESGNYTVCAYRPDDDYYTYAYSNESFTVLENTISLTASNITMFYHDGTRFIVSLTDSNLPLKNESLMVNINNVTYLRKTDDKGLISMEINLNSGYYDVSVTYTDEKSLNHTVYASIFVKSTVDSSNMVKIFRNGTQFYGIFCDFKGNHLNGTNVTFNINGVYYNRTTNNRGVARLNINLEQGNYTITSVNTLTGEMASNTISVLPSILDNNDVVKYYRNSTQYVICIIDGSGNYLSNSGVTFNINGVFYTRLSNLTGHVRLNLNLQTGNYTVTAEFNGCRVSNNVEILSVLKADNLTKRYGTGDAFKVYVADGVGDGLANANVIFNINGVFYTRLSDDSGVASLNIHLQSGEYLITSSYNDLNIVNKVTVV